MWDWVVVELLGRQLLLVAIKLLWVCRVGVGLRQDTILTILRGDVLWSSVGEAVVVRIRIWAVEVGRVLLELLEVARRVVLVVVLAPAATTSWWWSRG